MQTIKLDRHVQARVWIDENPRAIYPATEIISKNIANGLTKKNKNKRGSVEILIPVGARFFYGFLGAEFIPNDSDSFGIEILVSTEHENIYAESIASEFDQIRLGLPSEYSQSVLDGAIESLAEKKLGEFGSGMLRFDQAAHSQIGSSNKFFRHIARTVVQLLMIDRSRKEEISEIVKTYSLV
ncbi:hypothetical protein [Coleofasciculus sp.]|uniref:hypothetical protein n=1 Tax=Coleofasciculus sp. TaxID=3100458 RepID=UPI0039F81097